MYVCFAFRVPDSRLRLGFQGAESSSRQARCSSRVSQCPILQFDFLFDTRGQGHQRDHALVPQVHAKPNHRLTRSSHKRHPVKATTPRGACIKRRGTTHAPYPHDLLEPERQGHASLRLRYSASTGTVLAITCCIVDFTSKDVQERNEWRDTLHLESDKLARWRMKACRCYFNFYVVKEADRFGTTNLLRNAPQVDTRAHGGHGLREPVPT